MLQKHKIIIVDDHPLFIKGLKFAIESTGKCEVIAEASNGKDFLRLLNSHNPDIILTDINMPEMNGIEMTKEALKLRPELKIVAISMSDEEKDLHDVISAGAVGFLLKEINVQELSLAMDQIAAGKNYYSTELLPYFTNRYLGKQTNDVIQFTTREREILELIAKGMDNHEMAEQLFISIRTVEGHKASLISKTGSKNVVNLLLFAIRNKLVRV